MNYYRRPDGINNTAGQLVMNAIGCCMQIVVQKKMYQILDHQIRIADIDSVVLLNSQELLASKRGGVSLLILLTKSLNSSKPEIAVLTAEENAAAQALEQYIAEASHELDQNTITDKEYVAIYGKMKKRLSKEMQLEQQE